MSEIPDTINTTSSVYESQNRSYAHDKAMTMCEYLKEHIMDELEGAKDYMMKAVEFKNKKPKWAERFYKMSEMEAEHANMLSNIFTSIDDEDELCQAKMYKEIMEAYNTNMLEVANLKKLYYSK